ncbi:tetratricopeptide repeat protein [uncultured Lutibacter sp.]|uniref:tetratricopeptide repeat protein n=1 Tax=uncultured Lutibacter sp. TaxID=437739 RepID=UPI0026338A0E|nr:tetratricopeptide repeat protein [uncultured Lutibacter sp.]
MKNLILSIVLLFNLVAFSQTSNEIFDEANNLYKNGKYTKAIELYLSIEKQGLASDNLYYNLGNCYYKLNKVAPSIYYYEKALKLNPVHEDANSNLAFAKRMTIDVIEELPKTFFQRFSANIIQKLPFDTWAIIAVIASFLVAMMFLLYYFSLGTRKKFLFFNGSILAAFIMVVSTFFAFNNYKTVQKNRTAIIYKQKVEIKNAPTKTSEEVFELHEGTKVIILDELDDWKKIKIADGKIGWMPSTGLKEI